MRLIRWKFYLNGGLVHSTAYGTSTAPLAIGTGSTYTNLVATDDQIVSFLTGLGHIVPVGTLVQVRVELKNCDNETALSNPVKFIAAVAAALCLCDFVKTYSTGAAAITPSPGGQVAFINGLLNEVPIVNTIDPGDEVMVLALSGLCGDAFQANSTTGQTGNVTVPPAFLAAVPQPSTWLVARNGLLQSTYSPVFGFAAITPAIPSDPADQWLFVGLTGGDCALTTIAGSASANGASLVLPAALSAANAAKWFPVKNGVALYDAANTVSGYTVAANTITFEDALVNDEIWYILLD